MINQFHKIPWSQLKHAGGFADDVPELIIALSSTNIDKVNNAFYQLHENIWHQGTTYQATPFAVPFLYDLLNDKKNLRREDIIYFLLNCSC